MADNTFQPAVSLSTGKAIDALPPGSHIVVVGAGAFGGWTSLFLLRKKYKVTLIDCWGPGNSRSSSGDETRVIRSTYGANRFYFDLNVRALQLWKEHEVRWRQKLFQNKGVLWFCYHERTPVVDDSIPFAREHEMMYEKLSLSQLQSRYPIVNVADIHHAWFDPYGGCLRAREAMQAVHKTFIEEGGIYVQSMVQPGKIGHGKSTAVKLDNGTFLNADVFIFACGSWLGQLFPDVLGKIITCSKQEVYYFGLPSTHTEAYEKFPVWVDVDGQDFYYGIPGNNYRGFKIGVDKRGEPFNPTTGDRTINHHVLEKARQFISHRFPGLKDAPLIENRVCPYENSPDGNFLFDQHPEASNIFFLGGGSGHGFKHGPALGELIAKCLSENTSIPTQFLLEKDNATL